MVFSHSSFASIELFLNCVHVRFPLCTDTVQSSRDAWACVNKTTTCQHKRVNVWMSGH